MTETALSNDQDTLPGIDPPPTYQLSPVTEFNTTEIALADFKLRYESLVFNVGLPAGMEDAKKARLFLRTQRTGVEKRRKDLKEDILARGRLIDGEAKRITAEIEALEDPIDAQIKAEEARKEEIRQEKARAEAARVRAIHDKIDGIRNHGMTVRSALGELQRALAALQALTISDDEYLEFTPIATLTREKAIAEVQTLIGERSAYEAEQAALAAAKKAQEEESRRIQREQEALRAEREEMDKRRRELEAAEARQREAELQPDAGNQEDAAPVASVEQEVPPQVTTTLPPLARDLDAGLVKQAITPTDRILADLVRETGEMYDNLFITYGPAMVAAKAHLATLGIKEHQ